LAVLGQNQHECQAGKQGQTDRDVIVPDQIRLVVRTLKDSLPEIPLKEKLCPGRVWKAEQIQSEEESGKEDDRFDIHHQIFDRKARHVGSICQLSEM